MSMRKKWLFFSMCFIATIRGVNLTNDSWASFGHPSLSSLLRTPNEGEKKKTQAPKAPS